MGVGIDIHRLRIESHHNLTNCRNRLHCLKGKLWNQILLMFYLNVFYFPYLQSLLKKEKSIREVCQWYVQMVDLFIVLCHYYLDFQMMLRKVQVLELSMTNGAWRLMF